MKVGTSLALFIFIGSNSQAQTGQYQWQVSTDNLSWSSLASVQAGTLVHVRVLASWTGLTGPSVAFAGGQFDAILIGNNSAASISNIALTPPWNFIAQNLVASQYAGGTKIDSAADLAAPGSGTGWVGPTQSAEVFAPPGTYNTHNPAVVFTYDVIANVSSTVSMVLNPTVGRAMSIYVVSTGGQTRINASAVTISTATISVPTLGTLPLLFASVPLIARRRR